jgi:hypothetical protein
VSLQAFSCPTCGQPLQAATRSEGRDNFTGKVIIVVLLIIGAIWFLIATISRMNREQRDSERISQQLQDADSHR